MMAQMKRVRSIDALLVLGGETKDHSRTNHAYNLWHAASDSTRNYEQARLPLVLSGGYTGLLEEQPDTSEAQLMCAYLEQKGIPRSAMVLEDKSKDTFGNLVFSRPLLDQLLSGDIRKEVGIITDPFHMRRSAHLARKIFPKQYDITEFPTTRKGTIRDQIINLGIDVATRLDLAYANILQGDQEAFENYLHEKNIFYVTKHTSNNQNTSPKAPFSFYNLGVAFMKQKSARQFLPWGHPPES